MDYINNLTTIQQTDQHASVGRAGRITVQVSWKWLLETSKVFTFQASGMQARSRHSGVPVGAHAECFAYSELYSSPFFIPLVC
jgi:hypothetical protein